MKLHFREMGHGQPLIILHGLFGTSDNWQTLAKKFSETYHVFLVDMRNHGRSPHSHEFNYELMGEDICKFLDDNQIKMPVVMGHSMGGKAAMKFALEHPEHLIKLVVVDIAPKAYPVHHDKIIEGLKSIDLANLKNREEADQQLAEYIDELDTRLFLLKNLYRKEDGTFGWRVNLQAVDENIDQLGASITGDSPCRKPALFIRGGKSNYIKLEDQYTCIEHYFPNFEIETIPEAGHWVHAEAPEKVYTLVNNFINRVHY